MQRTFRDALIDRMAGHDLSLRQIAAQAQVSYQQLKKMVQREGASTNVDDAVKVARVFGLSLDEFLSDDLSQEREELVRLWQKLTPEERSLLRAAARGMRDKDQPLDS